MQKIEHFWVIMLTLWLYSVKSLCKEKLVRHFHIILQHIHCRYVDT